MAVIFSGLTPYEHAIIEPTLHFLFNKNMPGWMTRLAIISPDTLSNKGLILAASFACAALKFLHRLYRAALNDDVSWQDSKIFGACGRAKTSLSTYII